MHQKFVWDVSTFREFYTSLVVNMGGILIGADLAFSAYMVPGQENAYVMQETLVGSLNFFSRPLGSIMILFVVDRIGRKRTMQLACSIYIVAWGLIAFGSIYLGRILSGFAAGIGKCVLLYLTEVMRKDRRGLHCSISAGFISLGMSLSYVIEYFFGNTTMAIICCVVTICRLIQLNFIPETKYFYMARNDRKKAKDSLMWFSPKLSSEAVEKELDDIEKFSLQNATDKTNIFRILRNSRNLKTFSIALAVLVLRAGTGRVPITAHMEHFVSAFHLPFDSKFLVLVLGMLEFVFAVLFSTVVDKIKRKTSVSSFSMAAIVSIILLLACRLLYTEGERPLAWLQIILIYTYAIILTSGIYPSTLLIVQETVATSYENRGSLVGLLYFIDFIVIGVYSFVFPMALITLDISVILFYFLISCTLMLVVVKCGMPETRGRVLHCCNIKKTDNETNIRVSVIDLRER